MNKTIKKILIAFAVVIVLTVLFIGFYTYKFKSEIDKMTPVSTRQIVPGIYAVKDNFVNLYLLKHGDKYIAVDAGNDPETVLLEMAALSIDPLEVDMVLLTHSDSDHIAAVKNFINAVVYLPEMEEQMISGRTNRFLIFSNSLETIYTPLTNNQVLKFDNLKIRSIATPGHTPGSMSFLVNDKYLFVGDSMSLLNGKVGLFNDAFNMDNKTQKKSLLELAKLNGITHIFTAHYGFTGNFRKAFENFQ